MDTLIRRDCPHPGSPHRHGTTTAYNRDRCRCAPCSRANARDCKRYAVRKAQGIADEYVDPAPVRNHIVSLLTHGARYNDIAAAAGVSESAIRYCHQGKRKGIRKSTAKAILSVQHRTAFMAGSNQVPVTGARRRLQALVAIGYSVERLARLLGMNKSGIIRVVNPDAYESYRWIGIEEHHKITAVYEFLWNSPADWTTRAEHSSVTYCRNRAARKGWLPPMAWDDDTIDDPAYDPNHLYYKKAS